MNKDLPFVSISISFFNAESSLLNAVRSVFMQTYKNWELILINDGSTDKSLELAYSINDPRVRVYSDGENRKLAARLNQSIQLSQYDFIVRMDADDLMSPDRIEKQMKVLIENDNIDLVTTGVLSLSADLLPVGTRCVSENHFLTPRKLIFSKSGILHASIVARKEWYRRNNYNEKLPFAEDKELWIRSYSKSDLKVYFIKEPLYFYNEDNSVSRVKLLRAYEVNRKIVKGCAGGKFSVWLRLYAYISYLVKSSIVYSSSFLGGLSYIRSRRNEGELSGSENVIYSRVIESICRFDLPLSDGKSISK